MCREDTFIIYFEESLKIHAICADLGYSEELARIFAYMHSKAHESGMGIEYFDHPAPEDSEALEIMLGEKKFLEIPSIMSLEDEEQDAVELILSIAGKISHLDGVLARECGLENRLSGELRARLKLYKCKEYRDTMISIYKNEIITRIDDYNRQRIDEAFRRYHLEKERAEREILELAGFKTG